MRVLGVLLLLIWPFALFAQSQDVPLVTVEADPEVVAVGQPVVVRVTVLVPTWLPSPPVFPSFEIPNVIVRLPSRASGPTSQKIESETWSGVSRAYRMYPMTAGSFGLPSQSIEVTYADPDNQSPIKVSVALPPVSFTAEIPEGAEDLDPLIVAENVTLDQSFEGPEDILNEGDAIIRTVEAKITGSSALFIPPLIETLENPSVQAYPKDGTVRETENRGVLSGSRQDSTTYVAQYGGTLALPDVTLRWFNTKTGKVETLVAEGRSFQIEAPDAPRTPLLSRQQWIALIGLVLIIALILVVFRRYVWGTLVAWRAERKARYLESEKYAARLVGQAMGSRDLSSTRNALAVWSMRLAPVGGIADQELEQSLLALGAAQFSENEAGKPDWTRVGAAFAAARKVRRAAQELRQDSNSLPPLNPF